MAITAQTSFGGCRCLAFLLAGDAGATDPVCHWSPLHHVVEQALAQVSANASPLEFRTYSE